MNKDEEQDRELMHRVLDGEASPQEQQDFRDRLARDAGFRLEFEALERAVRAVEAGARMEAPAFFTAAVMKQLPQRKPGLRKRLAGFLLRGRTLRWNMATALAACLLLVATFAVWNLTRPGAGQDGREVMVTMKLYAPDAGTVSVAGTFNKWKTDADLLKKEENGYWTITVPLEPGDYTYMFVVDGKAWVADPNAESYRDDGFGSQNAVLRVKT